MCLLTCSGVLAVVALAGEGDHEGEARSGFAGVGATAPDIEPGPPPPDDSAPRPIRAPVCPLFREPPRSSRMQP